MHPAVAVSASLPPQEASLLQTEPLRKNRVDQKEKIFTLAKQVACKRFQGGTNNISQEMTHLPIREPSFLIQSEEERKVFFSRKRKEREEIGGWEETERDGSTTKKRKFIEEKEKKAPFTNNVQHSHTHLFELHTSRPFMHSSTSRGKKPFLLPMKGTIYLDNIKSGLKKFEGRVNGPLCQNLSIGSLIDFFDRSARRGIQCEVTSCETYSSFHEMLEAKGVINMLPQLSEKAKFLDPNALIQAGVNIYCAFPGAGRVKTLGAIAIGVKYLKDIRRDDI